MASNLLLLGGTAVENFHDVVGFKVFKNDGLKYTINSKAKLIKNMHLCLPALVEG